MKPLRALIRKELIALVRDLHGLAALFLLPVVFIVIMSMALKDVYSPKTNQLAWSYQKQDSGVQAQRLLERWTVEFGQPVVLPRDWQAALREGRLKYVLSIGPQASHDLAGGGIPDRKRIVLQTEPGLDFGVYSALKASLQAQTTGLRVEALVERLPQQMRPAATALNGEHVARIERLNAGPRPTSVQHNVPAWLVFSMFFVVTTIAGLFIAERDSGTLQRLRSMGVPAMTQVLAKILPYMLINSLQAALMLAVGVWLIPLLGGDALSLAGISWPALLLMLLAISLAAISLALLLATLLRSHAQVAAVGPIVNVLMAAVGGIMVPTFVMPPAMQSLAHFSPMNWALEGLLDVLLRGGATQSVASEALSLLALALVCLMLATVSFRIKRT